MFKGNYSLYVHIAPNGKLYIGITSQDVKTRWGSNGNGYYDSRKSRQVPFYNAILKYGWGNIKHIVLLENLSRFVAVECEKYLISKYHTTDRKFGYNLTRGGDGVCGIVHSDASKEKLSNSLTGRKLSEEHKRHISEALKGKPHDWQRGKHLPESTLLKLSQSLMGHDVSQETRNKIRIANTGKHPTDEVRLKMSLNNGMHNPDVVARVTKSLAKSQKERTAKRMQTMKEKYPDGYKLTEEQKSKISASMKGKLKTEETKNKMRKPKSEEHIEHMREAQKLSHEARKLGMTYKEYKNYLSEIGNMQS